MPCNRCPLSCSGGSSCGVVDASRQGDLYPWHAVYMSLLPVEEVPLYHTCPGGLTARIMVPGAPWRCGVCFWSQYASPQGLVLRRLGDNELARLRLARPHVLLVDGGEPLLQDWVLELPSKLKSILGGYAPRVYAFRTTGLVSERRLEEAASNGYSVAVFEYVLAVEKPPMPDHVTSILPRVYEQFRIVEIHVLYDGSRRAGVIVSDLASKYTEAAIHVIPLSEEAADRAYTIVEKLRNKGLGFVYLYRDESYTVTDTLCSCGKPLLSRKPWGVRIHAQPAGGGDGARCPHCGRVHSRILLCREEARRPRSIYREIVIW
ncbi:hypothetical protein [Hyperthermus butylicus]|uniref:Uncharacterized protein n=1 Tax=Hyperthermus butylicus (strain DSM 5456 / JCM 9403 / PLM1-5) TaxID=415426 RepID=A2BKZ2_HYPBU|nr:hypothetical protein [Hyperthermus butylicus]ABM80653.1 hypothetical protein Hbut_0800 [Hyperthermus butylicus DSM 5456]